MKFNNILLSSLLLMGVASANAQEPAKTVYDFQPHWFVQLQAGGQYTLGETKFSDLLSPTAQVAVGYNFNKVFGMRLQANAWQSRGGWKLDGNKYKWKYNYVAPGVDFMFNLSNLFCGFNPNRVVDVTVFAGAGANIAWNNDEAQTVYGQIAAQLPESQGVEGQNLDYLWDGSKVRFVGRAGADVDFRVSDRVKIGIEVNANVLNDHYNSKKAGNPDWYFNALAGVKIALGKTHTKRVVEAPKPVERIIERIVEKPVPTPVKEEKKVEALRKDVFFTIGSNKISATEEAKIKELVDYLNENKDAKVAVTGYADAGTGSAKINEKIAAKRAQAVVAMLRDKYGVSESRITSDSKGAYIQPFSENDKNRVSICIAE